MILYVYIRDEHVGYAERGLHYAQHYFCPHCAEIWARIVSPTDALNNIIVEKCCPECWPFQTAWLPHDAVAPVFYEYDERGAIYNDPLRFSSEVLKRDFLWLMEQHYAHT